MKKFLALTLFLVGMAVNAVAIDVYIFYAEVSPDCIEYFVVVTDDDGEIIGTGEGTAGRGCPNEGIETDPDSPNDMHYLMSRYPEIQQEIDDAYQEYLQKQ